VGGVGSVVEGGVSGVWIRSVERCETVVNAIVRRNRQRWGPCNVVTPRTRHHAEARVERRLND
jgi:hypothetical protein